MSAEWSTWFCAYLFMVLLCWLGEEECCFMTLHITIYRTLNYLLLLIIFEWQWVSVLSFLFSSKYFYQWRSFPLAHVLQQFHRQLVEMLVKLLEELLEELLELWYYVVFFRACADVWYGCIKGGSIGCIPSDLSTYQAVSYLSIHAMSWIQNLLMRVHLPRNHVVYTCINNPCNLNFVIIIIMRCIIASFPVVNFERNHLPWKMASRGRGRGFSPRVRGGRGGRNFYQQYDQGPPEFVVGAYNVEESS